MTELYQACVDEFKQLSRVENVAITDTVIIMPEENALAMDTLTLNTEEIINL